MQTDWAGAGSEKSQFDYTTEKCRSQICYLVANTFCILLVSYKSIQNFLLVTHPCGQFGYTCPLLSSQWRREVAIGYLATG